MKDKFLKFLAANDKKLNQEEKIFLMATYHAKESNRNIKNFYEYNLETNEEMIKLIKKANDSKFTNDLKKIFSDASKRTQKVSVQNPQNKVNVKGNVKVTDIPDFEIKFPKKVEMMIANKNGNPIPVKIIEKGKIVDLQAMMNKAVSGMAGGGGKSAGGTDWFINLVDTPKRLGASQQIVSINEEGIMIWRDQVQNVRFISSIDDLPDPVAGVITLEANIHYVLTGNVVLGTNVINPSSAGNNQISTSAFGFVMSYSGTGAMFTNNAMAGIFFIERLILTAPNGSYFDLSGASAALMQTDKLVFLQSASMGTISDIAVVWLQTQYVNSDTGLVLTDNNGITIRANDIRDFTNSPGCVFISINGTQQQIQISENFMRTAGVNEAIFDIDAASTTTGGVVSTNSIDIATSGGSVFAAGSKDQTDLSWKYTGNTNIADSKQEGYMYIQGSTTQTILTIGIPTKALGTFLEENGERFSFADNRLTYDGIEEHSFRTQVNVSASTSTGTNQDIEFYINKGNDTTNLITAFADAGGGQVTVTAAAHGLSNGDLVVITNTTNYNGTFTVANATANTFEITDTWVSDDATGNWASLITYRFGENRVGGGDPKSTSFSVIENYNTDDYIELFVANNTAANPIIVKSADIYISL